MENGCIKDKEDEEQGIGEGRATESMDIKENKEKEDKRKKKERKKKDERMII